MIYIYNCFAGTHSSALAAAYHLKKIPRDKIPSKEEILNIDIFNKLTPNDFGRFIYHGKDEEANEVYTFGRGKSKDVVPAMESLLQLLHTHGVTHDKMIFSNASPTVPIAMTFGGLFSRRLHIDWIGVPLLIKGAQQTYPNVQRLVEKTIKTAKTTKEHITILDNKEIEVNKLFPN
ncbi:DUF3189 family protein [Sutcliffiella cohnii]